MVLMSDSIEHSLSGQTRLLVKKIESSNKKADLYGLFSYHILSNKTSSFPTWRIFCNDDDWIKKSFDKDNVYHIAALGYSIFLNRKDDPEIISEFSRALEKLKQRDLFDGTHVTFPFNPLVFLGLVFGVNSLGKTKNGKRYIDWLSDVLNERLKRVKPTLYQEIFYKYIEVELKKNKPILTLPDIHYLDEASFYLWGVDKGFFAPSSSADQDGCAANILSGLLNTEIQEIEPDRASLILYAMNSAISGGIARILKSHSALTDVLSKFESSMKRWRFDNDTLASPIKWPITSEREVQDIVWIILRPYFADLIDEETLPKLGHSSYRPDFAIPSLRSLVEVKFVRNRADFKRIEKEIIQDSVGYLTSTSDYNKIIVFIYDHSSSIQEHAETKRAEV